MREFNCDQLKSFTPTDDLVQKALAIPQTAAPAAPAAPARVPHRVRWLAAAAGFVLVATVGISVFFLNRNISESPLPIAPVPGETAAATERDTEPSAVSTESPTVQPSDTSAATIPATEPTLSQETVNPTHPANPDPTVAPTAAPTAPPRPTAAPITEPTAPPKPTVGPTEEPTDPEPPPPWEVPIAPSEDSLSAVGFMVPRSSYSGSGDIYCRLYSASGQLIGSGDLYDESHRVIYIEEGDCLYLSYPLAGVGEPLPGSYYTIVFYDGEGNDFYLFSAYLSKK